MIAMTTPIVMMKIQLFIGPLQLRFELLYPLSSFTRMSSSSCWQIGQIMTPVPMAVTMLPVILQAIMDQSRHRGYL
jgi:hypothetical protein